ncbi:hypothetical protein VTN77DRAFT_8996 [Rasamsonia byssochlamydoides]|uniref:uncharacterized protein n=1 Tax=Rasamsonia byssochlamydoides TaxID=89139 RepID=UPI00374207E7
MDGGQGPSAMDISSLWKADIVPKPFSKALREEQARRQPGTIPGCKASAAGKPGDTMTAFPMTGIPLMLGEGSLPCMTATTAMATSSIACWLRTGGDAAFKLATIRATPRRFYQPQISSLVAIGIFRGNHNSGVVLAQRPAESSDLHWAVSTRRPGWGALRERPFGAASSIILVQVSTPYGN